jgi:hypothetical protein
LKSDLNFGSHERVTQPSLTDGLQGGIPFDLPVVSIELCFPCDADREDFSQSKRLEPRGCGTFATGSSSPGEPEHKNRNGDCRLAAANLVGNWV